MSRNTNLLTKLLAILFPLLNRKGVHFSKLCLKRKSIIKSNKQMADQLSSFIFISDCTYSLHKSHVKVAPRYTSCVVKVFILV